MIRRIALALVSLAVVSCSSAPVRTTASHYAAPQLQKMSLEDIFLDDSEQQLADAEEKLGDGYQAESVRPYHPAGDSAAH